MPPSRICPNLLRALAVLSLQALIGVSVALLAPPLRADAATATILHSFDDGSAVNPKGAPTLDGTYPASNLVYDSSTGFYYGTTASGGSTSENTSTDGGYGSAFEMSPSGQVTILHNFGDGSVTNDGSDPNGLILGSDGNLYGTTRTGGQYGEGAIFQMTPTGSITIEHSFGLQLSMNYDGALPMANLVEASDGTYYGTTSHGGYDPDPPFSSSYGTVYSFIPGASPGTAGTVVVLTDIGLGTSGFNASLGEYPEAGVIIANDGNLYGTTAGGGANADGVLFELSLASDTYTVQHSFGDPTVPNDGQVPLAPLVQGSDNNLYGTTSLGGGTDNGGTVFSSTLSGAEAPIHEFTVSQGDLGTDGSDPVAGLVAGSDLTFYGTTKQGGSAGDGTVFSVTSTGSFTLLHSFFDGSTTNDGISPQSSLIMDSSGNLLGTTYQGGSTYNAATTFNGYGTVFEVNLSGSSGGLPATTTTLSSTANPSTAGQSVTFIATVAPSSGSGTPTGTVTFTINGMATSPVTLSNGGAAYSTALSAGSYSVSAAYSGNSSYAGSTSSTLTQTVNSGTTPNVLTTFPAGLQMISVDEDYTSASDSNGTGLAAALSNPSPVLAVWTTNGYVVTPTAPANDLVPGQGYWIRNSGSVNLYDDGTQPPTTVAINLTQGWNMIGCPFSTGVPFQAIEVSAGGTNYNGLAAASAAGAIGLPLYTFAAGATGYTPVPATGTLNTFTGYWIFAPAACTLTLVED